MTSGHTQSAPPSCRCTHAPECVSAVWFAAIALAVFGACDTRGVTLIDPDVAGGPDSVAFHVSLEDTLLARALGWEDGVPGAEIQLHRIVDPFQPHVLNTDSAGNAYISTLLPGLYEIAGYTVLSPDETGPTGGVVRAFGDGFKQTVGSTPRVSLALAADEVGSLVMSEVYGGGLTHQNQYHWARFVELYNNSDTTVYLDGILLGKGFGRQYSAVVTCADNRPFREDPAGIWSPEFHQFPGGGREYPVAPGQVVTIALDAVDHSQVDPTLPDLSQSDFELQGSADPDNPDVPNMPPVGPRSDPQGHGMLTSPTQVLFLALPLDATGLQTRVHMKGVTYARVPSDHVLDVVSGWTVTPDSDPAIYLPTYDCLNWVNREFDRLEAVLYRPDGDNRTSTHRKVLRVVAGREILQDVDMSRIDFVLGHSSPGQIEY